MGYKTVWLLNWELLRAYQAIDNLNWLGWPCIRSCATLQEVWVMKQGINNKQGIKAAIAELREVIGCVNQAFERVPNGRCMYSSCNDFLLRCARAPAIPVWPPSIGKPAGHVWSRPGHCSAEVATHGMRCSMPVFPAYNNWEAFFFMAQKRPYSFRVRMMWLLGQLTKGSFTKHCPSYAIPYTGHTITTLRSNIGFSTQYIGNIYKI